MDNRLNDLDDVEQLLQEKKRVRPITKTKNAVRRNARHSKYRREARLEQGILAIPLTIVILICAVLILDPIFGVKDGASETILETEAETAETPAAETEPEERKVERLEDQELTDFFNRYFEARLSADVDTLNQMSGVTNQSEEQRQQLLTQLKTQAGYIERYQNLVLYGVQGLEEQETLVFLRYDVKFRRAETLAPAIMYCYVVKTAENGYALVENRSPEQVRFINLYTTEHEEVLELINYANSQLLEALSSDSRLATIYDAFQTGRIYTEDMEDIDSEVSLISVETEAEETVQTTASDNDGTRSTEAPRETTKAAETTETEAVIEAADPGEAAPDAGEQGGPEQVEINEEAPAGDVLEIADNPGA